MICTAYMTVQSEACLHFALGSQSDSGLSAQLLSALHVAPLVAQLEVWCSERIPSKLSHWSAALDRWYLCFTSVKLELTAAHSQSCLPRNPCKIVWTVSHAQSTCMLIFGLRSPHSRQQAPNAYVALRKWDMKMRHCPNFLASHSHEGEFAFSTQSYSKVEQRIQSLRDGNSSIVGSFPLFLGWS